MKGKASGSIVCTRKQQPRFYSSRSSVVMNDATKPWECMCSNVDMEGSRKCGPCKKWSQRYGVHSTARFGAADVFSWSGASGLGKRKIPPWAVTDGKQIPGTSAQQQEIGSSERQSASQWCGVIHYHWWTALIKPRMLFSRAGYASWGLSLSV